MGKNITDTILMIRPGHFGFNKETALNNSFQINDTSISKQEISDNARREFDAMVELLRSVGITVIVIEDTDKPIKPDAVFPNNWFSTHSNGSFITYPMYSPIRRAEKREDIYTILKNDYGFDRRYTFDFYEEKQQFLEGTGSMILDRENKIVYACLSDRTEIRILEKFCVLMGYKKLVFNALDKTREPIYHTNVMMALGESFVVICLECIPDKDDKKALIKSFEQSNREIIEISLDQVGAFAGNMIQVQGEERTYIIMSETAYESLTKKQIKKIKAHTSILTPEVPTIENYGGGSVRCMMAEIFSPEKHI